MLAAAVALGAPTSTYLDPGQPVQQRILHNVGYFAGLSRRDIVVAVDGCSAPVFGLPIYAMALAYARLASPQRLLPEKGAVARRIVAAMQTYPAMVAGTDRFDTDLMAACPMRLVAKGGAEGVHCVGIPELGAGIAVKIEGGHGPAATVATMEVLRGLSLLDEPALARLDPYRLPEVLNVRGRVVGHMTPLFTYGE
jgi:L-asparaginase II